MRKREFLIKVYKRTWCHNPQKARTPQQPFHGQQLQLEILFQLISLCLHSRVAMHSNLIMCKKLQLRTLPLFLRRKLLYWIYFQLYGIQIYPWDLMIVTSTSWKLLRIFTCFSNFFFLVCYMYLTFHITSLSFCPFLTTSKSNI